jgi:hexosaminidase
MKKYFLLFSICMYLISCSNSENSDGSSAEMAIIPLPASMKLNAGHFVINSKTVIYYKNADLLKNAEYLSSQLADVTGFSLKIKEGFGKGINLLIPDAEEKLLGDEGYNMHINHGTVDIIANTPGGIFYAAQTLLQMLPPPKKLSSLSGKKEWKIRCADIEDMPRFKWRGILLDVSRHFFTTEEVKRLIDQMAMYKFNLLHLHLTDDQGWRIEIKKLPELTKKGAWRVPRTGLWWDRESPKKGEEATYGGFYTHEEIKDLVAYAAEHHVDILPEIEAPGHSLAAIASYPFLSSTGLKYEVNPGSKFYGIDDNSLCAGKESTFEFLNTVFTEVAELFPFEYIHIGGDECYKGFWKKCPDCQKVMRDNGLKDENELQSYFIRRLETMLEEKGKKLIGWDEILEGGLAPKATVMSWRGMEGGIAAAKENHHVVMSPNSYAYLDLYQGDPAIEPPTYSMLRFSKVYEFEPVPEGIDPEYILGGQGNLWTESVPTFRHAEYMLWPRSFALSEILWSPKEARDWTDFVSRTEAHLDRLSHYDINYALSFYDPIITPLRNSQGEMEIELDTEIEGLDIYYSFNNTYPDHHSPLYKMSEKLAIPKDADTFRVITYREGKPAGRLITVPLDDLKKRIRN